MSKRILVAGGAGFMGSHISRRFVELGYEVFIIDNFAVGTPDNIKGIDYMSGDCSNISDVRSAFRYFKPEVIYNLAAFAREGTSSLCPLMCIKNNIDVHANLVTEGIRSPNFEKIVYFSSEAVYGNGIPPFDEKTPRNPCDPYGSAKAFCEEFTESMSKVHGFKYTIIRPHNVFGPGQSLRDRGRNVIAIFINQTMRKEPITIYGDGSSIRAFSYIDNSLRCYVNAIDGFHSRIFNVGDDEPISINEVAKVVGNSMRLYGYDHSPIIHLRDRPLEIETGFATTEKQNELGYEKKVNFVEGVNRMAEWASKQGPSEWLNIPVELPLYGRMPESWR